jgi:hypothetical protein
MIERFLAGLEGKMEDPDGCTYMSIVLPVDLDPFERHYRFGVFIDAELRLAGIGCSVGGGTLYQVPDGDDCDDEPQVVYSQLDVDATDVFAVRALLRMHLPELGAPAGTLIMFGEAEDRFDGNAWLLNQPSSVDED